MGQRGRVSGSRLEEIAAGKDPKTNPIGAGPFMFKEWKSYDTAIPGLIKWLDLAAGYGHLNYYRWNWCLQPIDRAIAVEVKKA